MPKQNLMPKHLILLPPSPTMECWGLLQDIHCSGGEGTSVNNPLQMNSFGLDCSLPPEHTIQLVQSQCKEVLHGSSNVIRILVGRFKFPQTKTTWKDQQHTEIWIYLMVSHLYLKWQYLLQSAFTFLNVGRGHADLVLVILCINYNTNDLKQNLIIHFLSFYT